MFHFHLTNPRGDYSYFFFLTKLARFFPRSEYQFPEPSLFGIGFAVNHLNRNRFITKALLSKSNMKTDRNTDSYQLPTGLEDLLSAIQTLPEQYRQELERPLNRVVDYTRRRRKILNLIQEALSQLRIDMKYLMFDLEATRRERDSYKNTLED